MAQAKTAVVIGATGLIGTELTNLLVEDDAFSEIKLLVRKPYVTALRKLQIIQVDFSNPAELEKTLGSPDVLFCCIGTTQKKVKGDKQAYRKVDYDIPVHSAAIAKRKGCSAYMLVSAIGADASSGNVDLQLIGQVEDAITATGFETAGIFRPSVLLGNRKEFRLGELIGKAVIQFLSPLLAGSLRKYKPISGNNVAKAMIAAAKQALPGTTVYAYDDMKKLAG